MRLLIFKAKNIHVHMHECVCVCVCVCMIMEKKKESSQKEKILSGLRFYIEVNTKREKQCSDWQFQRRNEN